MGIECRHLAGKDFQKHRLCFGKPGMPDWMTVEAMLDYLRPFSPSRDRGLEEELVRQFDLPLKRKLKHLSRGMRMKAASPVAGLRAKTDRAGRTFLWSRSSGARRDH